MEDQAAFDEALEEAETGAIIGGERRVISAKTLRTDRLFVKALEERKEAEERAAAAREEAAARESSWAEERAALERELARREEEVAELRTYLDALPVVKVTEIVDGSTGKLVDDPKYEFAHTYMFVYVCMYV